jgi:DNA modification methylase
MKPNTIYEGDCIETMKQWDAGCVQTCITSPPYYGLRDYGHEGQIGLEETPEAFVAKMVEVFREVKRVLRDDGTLWLNLGDSYSSHKDCKSIGQTLAKGTSRETAHEMEIGKSRVRDSRMLKSQGLKNKDLIGIPWMVAFALRADGWYLRQDIIWHKPNPMPESVTDRCTKAHEYIFLFSKSQKYHFDNEAIKEDSIHSGTVVSNNKGKNSEMGKYGDTRGGFLKDGGVLVAETRNKRSVWTVTTKPYSGAHFATFPPDLIEPCILAGAPEGGIVLDPFMGSGTTAHTALRAGRQYVGCELNGEYIKLANKRLSQGFLL